jgi:hypothetical protein
MKQSDENSKLSIFEKVLIGILIMNVIITSSHKYLRNSLLFLLQVIIEKNQK